MKINPRPSFLPPLKQLPVPIFDVQSDLSISHEIDEPSGFRRIGSLPNVPWFHIKKDNILFGIPENLYERPDVRKAFGKSRFFQVRLLAPCDCFWKQGGEVKFMKAEAGSIINLHYGPFTRRLENFILSIIKGNEHRIWLRCGDVQEVQIGGRWQEAHYIEMNVQQVQSASLNECEIASVVPSVLSDLPRQPQISVHKFRIDIGPDDINFSERDDEFSFDEVDESGQEMRFKEQFRSTFLERFHVGLEFGSDHCRRGDRSSYDEREDRSQSAGHATMAALIRRLAVQSGIEIYPRNVGVEGVWGMSDMLLMSGERYLFVEIQSDHALQDPKRLQRKLNLRNNHPFLFVVSPLADVRTLLSNGVQPDAILVADTCRCLISLLSSYAGIECNLCCTPSPASNLSPSSSLQSPVCLACERRVSPIMQVLVRLWDKLPKRIRLWAAQNMDTNQISDSLVSQFVEKASSLPHHHFVEHPNFSIEAVLRNEKRRNRGFSVVMSGRESNTNRGFRNTEKNTEIYLSGQGYFDLSLHVSVEDEWCSLCHRKPGRKSKQSVYAEEKCESCRRVHRAHEACCSLCKSSFPHEPDWTSKRACHLCSHSGCTECVPWVSDLTREKLHPECVSVGRFMEMHDRLGMRWKQSEMDVLRNMPIVGLLDSRKWSDQCKKTGMSVNKEHRWKFKLVEAAIGELEMSQDVDGVFSSWHDVVSHRANADKYTVAATRLVNRDHNLTIEAGHVCRTCSKKFQSLEEQLEEYRKLLLKRFRRLLVRLPPPEIRPSKIFKNPWIHLVPDTIVHAEALERYGNIVRLRLLDGCDVQRSRRIPPYELQRVPRWAPAGTLVSLEWSKLSCALSPHQLPKAIWIKVDSFGAKELRMDTDRDQPKPAVPPAMDPGPQDRARLLR